MKRIVGRLFLAALALIALAGGPATGQSKRKLIIDQDCAGPGGSKELLAAIRDSDHPEHDDMVRWVGRSFDPEAFNLANVNRRLRLLK